MNLFASNTTTKIVLFKTFILIPFHFVFKLHVEFREEEKWSWLKLQIFTTLNTSSIENSHIVFSIFYFKYIIAARHHWQYFLGRYYRLVVSDESEIFENAWMWWHFKQMFTIICWNMCISMISSEDIVNSYEFNQNVLCKISSSEANYWYRRGYTLGPQSKSMFGIQRKKRSPECLSLMTWKYIVRSHFNGFLPKETELLCGFQVKMTYR